MRNKGKKPNILNYYSLPNGAGWPPASHSATFKQLSPRAQRELLSQEEFCFGRDYKPVLETEEWEEGRVKGIERGLMAKKFECQG